MRASLVLILTEVLILNLTCTSRVRVRRHNLKVRITATGDTIVLKFLQLEADARLEGYILGYGSGMFSKQFIQLPEEGEHYETEIDAEPKYLIVVRPVKANNVKKKCTGKVSLEKPLHLMIGTVTPTSVQLSWGTLLNTPYTDAHLDDCIEDGDFTVRYKEKETSKKWNYETCPTTDTVIDNLKPDTPYEFEVRAETETNTGTWSPPVIHNTADIHIHEPLKSSNPLKPQIHVMEGPKVAFPPVTILHNITPSRQPPPVRQTASPPTPRRNQGTGSDGITPSSPSEDTLFSTQTLKFMQTLMNQRTSKTANPFQPQPSTLSPLSSRSLQQPHTIQFQLNTAKAQSSTPDTEPITQSITTKTQPSTTETHASTVKAQFHTTHIRTTQFHSTGQPQSNTIQPQFRTYQPHASTAIPHFRTSQPKPSTELVHCRTTRCDPQITQSIPRTTQKEPITAQPEPIITKPKHITAQKMPITAHPETIATKSLPSTKPQTPSTSQLRATQLKSLTTQAKPRILQKTSTTQSQTTKQIFSTALPTNVVQQQIPTQPNTIYEHVSLTLPQPQKTKKEPIKLHQPTLSGTTHHDPYEDMSKSIQEHNTYHHLDTTRPKQVSSTNASPTTSTKDNVFTNIPLTLTSPKTDKQGSMASQHLISQHTHYDTKETPSPVQTSDWYTPSTLEITAKTRDHPLRSTKFQKEPVLVQDHHPLSSTIKIPYTVQWQYAKTDSTPRSELRIINDLHSGANNVPEQPPTKIQANIIKKTPTKSNVSHWPETQAMNEKLSGSQEAPSQSQDGEPLPKPALVNEVVDRDQGQDISRNSSSPVLVTRPAGPKVVQPVGTKVVRPVGPKVVRPVGPKVVRPVGPKVVRPVGPKVVRNGTGPAKWASHNSSSPVVVRRPVGPTVVPALVSAVVRNETHPMKTDSRNPPRRVARPLSPTVGRNRTSTGRGPPGSSKNPKRPPKVPGGVKHQGLSQTKPTNRPRKHFGSPGHQRVSDSKKKNPNQVEQSTGKAKITDLKQVERLPVLKPQAAPSTEKTTYQKPTPTSMPLFAFNGSRFDAGPNSSIFRSVPVSDVDALGKKRFVAPHVFYKDKGPAEPCSVTQSLSLFPEEENEGINVTGPPKTPPSNVTVVTVEGCPSFVIVDWEKTDNETTEYEVSTKGPNGKEISVVTTNQTHTAVENLKPQSNYEFTVTPKNELGAGPSTDPVSFSTESADPRVSDIPTGKTAIWSSFPFKADSYTECNGRQFVKRTWYRKFVGIQLCNSLRYKIYLSDSLKGKFYTIGDQTGYGEDHCQFVDSYLDGRTGGPLLPHQLPPREGFFRSMRQEPVRFGKIGGNSQINYVAWYECGVPIPGSW